jgi:hypothetical protein
LKTIKIYGFSNKNKKYSRIDRIIPDANLEILDATFSNKNIFGYYHGTQHR